MLGARLKSWMEAQLGRAKKRKQKQARPPPVTTQAGPPPPPHLSSPESAYSTGYSTDGTSPGLTPATLTAPLAAPLVAPPPPPAPPTTHLYHEPAKNDDGEHSEYGELWSITLHTPYDDDDRRSNISAVRRVTQPEVVLSATPSPRPRCRIRTNPWLGSSPDPRRKPPLPHQCSLQAPAPQPPSLQHAPYSLDAYPVRLPGHRSPFLSPHLSPQPQRSTYNRGASSDEECRGFKSKAKESPIPELQRSHRVLSDEDAREFQSRGKETKPGPELQRSYRILSDEESRAFRRTKETTEIAELRPCRAISSDEESRGLRSRGRETAILSDVDVDSEIDTGLDGGDEDDDETASPGRRRARRRRPPRRTPRSAGATPPRARRRHAPSATPVRERDPLLEADREAERKYKELIREAEKLLVTVSRAPIEPPHNPRVRELRQTEMEAPRRSPERTHLTNFMRALSAEPPRRPAPRRSPLAAPPRAAPRPHSEPPKRKAYKRDEVLQTLEGLRKSLQQQSALLAVQRTRLDSL